MSIYAANLMRLPETDLFARAFNRLVEEVQRLSQMTGAGNLVVRHDPCGPVLSVEGLATGSGTITVEEVDGSPSYTSVATLRFDQTDGYQLTQPSAHVVRVDHLSASYTQAGIVDLTVQTFAGAKTFYNASASHVVYVSSGASTANATWAALSGLTVGGFSVTENVTIASLGANIPAVGMVLGVSPLSSTLGVRALITAYGGDGPRFIFSYPIGLTARYCLERSDRLYNGGDLGTIGSGNLVFRGGLYIEGNPPTTGGTGKLATFNSFI